MSTRSPQEHARNVTGIFSRIAGVYDILNRVFSCGIDALWRKALAHAIGPAAAGNRLPILDLAAGTLEVTKERVRKYPDRPILAIDFCPEMLRAGQGKLASFSDRPIGIWVGDALHLPLASNSVGAVTVAFGLRNFKPRHEALLEILRVLSPGGTLCVLEFGSARDRILFGIYNWYLKYVLPCIGRIVSKDEGAYAYLAETVAAFPSAEELVQEFTQAGFKEVSFTRHTAGIVCIHCGRK